MFVVDLITQFSNNGSIWAIFMLFARFLGTMTMCPIFASSFFSTTLRSCLALLLSFIVWPQFGGIVLNSLLINILLVMSNLIYGCLLGYILSLPIWLIESCGKIIDTNRGEQAGAVINKITNNPSSSISNLLTRAFLTYFVINNGLLFIFDNIIKSFTLVPINKLFPVFEAKHIGYYIQLIAEYFYWVVVLVLPVIMAMFLLEILLGLISSFIPQINVTILAMPLKSSVALILLSIYIGFLFHNIFIKCMSNVQNFF